MLKKLLFSLLFTATLLGGLAVINSDNKALAIYEGGACKWVNSGQLHCAYGTTLSNAINTVKNAIDELKFSPSEAPVVGGAVESVDITKFDEAVLGVFSGATDVEDDMFFDPAASKNAGYPVFCGGSEANVGCIHFVSNNPMFGFVTQAPDTVFNGVPSGDHGNWIAVAEMHKALNSPGDMCGITKTTNCEVDDGDGMAGGTYNGEGANLETFIKNTEALIAAQELKEQCEREAPLGFILCPIFNGMVDGIGSLIGGTGISGEREGLLISFLTIQPLKSGAGTAENPSTALQQIVGGIIGVANLFYVVIFLLIIFSSSLPLGLDNYSIKKMLPKFIAAVILTQFAYPICGIVVDFFNLLGQAVPNLIFGLLTGVVDGVPSAGNIGTAIQQGLQGVLIANFAAAGVIFFATIGWLLMLILLIVVLVAIIVGFLYIVLRYLVIYILVLLSPIAFACWVLPGTEKFFYSWWKNFLRVNAVFPMITGMLAVAIVLAQVLINSDDTNGAIKLVAMLIPIVALFMIPKTLKWTTQGMNALAAGALGFAAGKLGSGAQAVGKGAKAGTKYAKSAGKDAANDYRAKKAGEMFGKGNKKAGALLMGKLPTGKGLHQAQEAASKYDKEIADRNQASLSRTGNSLQGLDLNGGVAGIQAQLRARNPKLSTSQANKQAQQIHQAAMRHGVDANGMLIAGQGNDLYGLELQRIAMGQGSSLLGVSPNDSAMQVSSVTELAQRGDFNLIHDAVQSGSLDQSTMMKGIQPNFGDVMAKAPDLVKGGSGAFNNIGAEKIAQLDRYSTERMVAHVSNGANFTDHTGAIDPVAHAAAVKNLHNEAARMAADPRIAAGMDPRARAALNQFLSNTGQPTI